jgi:hypothetical protein
MALNRRSSLPASGITDYFYKHQIRIFDYAKWAEPLREARHRLGQGLYCCQYRLPAAQSDWAAS